MEPADVAFRSLGDLELCVPVGRDPGAAGLEITSRGPELRVLRDSVLAVTGADVRPAGNGTPVETWTSFTVAAGDVVTFVTARRGARPYVTARRGARPYVTARRGVGAYLAVADGMDVPLTFGSRATNVRAGIGDIDGGALKAGDRLPSGSLSGGALTSEPAQPRPGDPVHLRAVDPDKAHDLCVACHAVGGGGELA